MLKYGLKLFLPNISEDLSLTCFQNDIKDQFAWTTGSQVINIEKTRTKGVESFLQYSANRICSLFRDTMLSREVKLILMNHQLYLKLNFFVNTML